MDSCRVCMVKNMNMFHIFGTDDIVNKIHFCTGIQFKKADGLPTQICNNCLEDLSVAHKFKTLCLLAEETLKNGNNNLNRSIIKEETPEVFVDTKEITLSDEINKFEECHVKGDFVEAYNDGVDVLEGDVSSVRKSSRLKLEVKNECLTDKDSSVKVRKKRGPYNKTGGGAPKRLRKFKFRKLYCEPCGMKFTSKQQSDEHRQHTHKDSDRYVCEICGKVFVYRASHYRHVRSHLPPEYACEHCDYRTWHKHDLIKHVRIHTDRVKHYQCEYCTASYHTSSNLAVHIRRHHERERRYPCELCERSFYDRTKYNRHMDSHNKIKRYKCDVCHACYTRRCYWKKHLLRLHNIIVPPQRPGPQKINRQVGEPNDAPLGKLVLPITI